MSPLLNAGTARKRRERIVRAALRCFSRRGFHRTSMSDLLAEAGVSAGAFYTWFDSKEAVIEAACARSGDTAHREIAEALAGDDVPEALARLLRLASSMFDRRGWRDESRVNVQVVAEAVHDARMRRAFAPAHDRFRGLIAETVRRGQARGQIAADLDADAAAHVVWGLYLGLEQQKALDGALDHRAFAKVAVALVTGRFASAEAREGKARR